MYTLSSDESVGMAQEKSVSWPQKLDTCYTKRLPVVAAAMMVVMGLEGV